MAQSHQRPFSRRQLAVIAKIAFIEAMALSLIIPTISSTGEITQPGVCTTTNFTCDQIKFDQVVFGNTSSTQSVITSNSWIASQNETIVLIADSNIGGVVTSITDTASDAFGRQILESQNCLPCENFEIWTAKYKGTSNTISTITVTWNATTNNVFVASTYFGVDHIGNTTAIQNGGATSGTLVILPFYSGSKIVGGTSVSPGTNVPCNTILPGTFLTQRRDSCSKAVGIPEVEVDVEDNMTTLRNSSTFTYSSSWPGQGFPTAFQMGAIELIGIDKEPQDPNFNHFCTDSNGLCLTVQYSINEAKEATSANALNQVLAPLTSYCSGITTSSITIGNHVMLGWANYGGVDLNTTSAKLQVQFFVSTNTPSTSFGVGQCATGGILLGVSYIFFSINGSLSATNAFTVSINGACNQNVGNACAAGTYFGWIEITPQNFSGHMNFDQVVNQLYSTSSINLMEIK